MSTTSAILITVAGLLLSALVCAILFGDSCPAIIILVLWFVFAWLLAELVLSKKKRK